MHTQAHRGADASKRPEGSVPSCTVLEKEEETEGRGDAEAGCTQRLHRVFL